MTSAIPLSYPSNSLERTPFLMPILNGESEAAEIMHSASLVKPLGTIQASYSGYSWCFEQTAAHSLYFLFSAFALGMVSYFLHAVCLKDFSKKVWVISQHVKANAIDLSMKKIFRESLLSKSINTHRKDTEDYFLQSSPHFVFFHPKGLCRGMCHWFIYLYFKTQFAITDSDQHVRAIGEQFTEGASRSPAFLHSLEIPDLYRLLKLGVDQNHLKIQVSKHTCEQMFRQFQSCDPGIYGIYMSSHQLVYIKTPENKQYLFDPEIGCLKITSTQLFKEAINPYVLRQDYTKNILIDKYFTTP